MGKKTKEMLEKINLLFSMGWSKRKIAKECGVTPPYVTRLMKIQEQNRKRPPGWDYGLSTRVLNCLKRGYIPLDLHVIADIIDQLLIMRGIGKCSLDEIGNVLKEHHIIDNIDEWIEEGKRKQYHQRESRRGEYDHDLSQQSQQRHIEISNSFIG